MSADEYVPDEEQVRAWCREGTGDYPDVMDEWITRFLARVKRDAAREAEAEQDEWRQTALDERAAALDALEQIKAREARIAEEKHLRMKATAAATKAEARVKAVRAIHRDLYESMSGVPYCDECDRAWPCPTIRALDGDA